LLASGGHLGQCWRNHYGGQTEGHLYVDLYCDRFAIFGSWLEYPLIDSFHGLLVQAETYGPKYF